VSPCPLLKTESPVFFVSSFQLHTSSHSDWPPIMVAKPCLRAWLLLCLGILSLSLTLVSAQSLRTFALEGGQKAAAEDDKYTCSPTKACEIGCCGAVYVLSEGQQFTPLTECSEIKLPGKVFVGLVLTSAGMAVYRRAATKASAILAGECSGRTLLHALSTFVAANSDSVGQLRIFATASLLHRPNVVRELQMRSSSDITKVGICRDPADVSVAELCTFDLILINAKTWSQKTFPLEPIPISTLRLRSSIPQLFVSTPWIQRPLSYTRE
jgi:hypothetical protein